MPDKDKVGIFGPNELFIDVFSLRPGSLFELFDVLDGIFLSNNQLLLNLRLLTLQWFFIGRFFILILVCFFTQLSRFTFGYKIDLFLV